MFVVSAKTVTRVLLVTVLVLTLASLGARFIDYRWGREGLLGVSRLFDVGEEGSIPTWYSSFTLLLSSLLLAVIGGSKWRQRDRYTPHWVGLAIIFLLLSVDEVAGVHEALGAEVPNSLGLTPSGFTYFFWVVPAAAFVLIFVLTYLRFLVRLPKQTRRLFLVAGALFVVGALGMEMLSARIISEYGREAWRSVSGIPKIVVGLQTSAEELLEMLGMVTFIYALLAYVGAYIGEVTVRVPSTAARARHWDLDARDGSRATGHATSTGVDGTSLRKTRGLGSELTEPEKTGASAERDPSL
jgi:hypothetical protein